MKTPILIVIGGPTASGKSSLAASIANYYNTVVINADSRQFYQELNIGVARPTEAELTLAPHYFVATESIHHPLNAALYAEKAQMILQEILSSKKIAVISGGSGLYLNALLYGFDSLINVPASVKKEVDSLFVSSLESVVKKLLLLSPDAAALVDIKNPHRVRRALELVLTYNKPLEAIWQGSKAAKFNHLGFYLNPERKGLYRQIDQRVLEMVESGLLEEANNLFKHSDNPVLNTIGYSELFEHIRGNLSIETAISKIQQHSRNYAKRQITWLKNKTDFTALDPENAKTVIIETLSAYGYTNHK